MSLVAGLPNGPTRVTLGPAFSRESLLVAAPPVARRSVAAAALTVLVVLTLTSNGYGFDRDELYFAMLHPAWGYVDQPPLVPLLAHALGGAGPWLLRIPATLCAAGSVVVTALTARELGGDARAQAWTAWGYAGTSAVLTFGHVLLTSSADLLLWPLVSLLVIRAELRHRPALWLVAGAVAGAATYNKLLIGWLLAGLALGYLLVGPRDRLRSPWVIGGAALALLLAVPNLAYQIANGWPQLEMGQALADNNADFTRWFMWVFLVVILGPPLVVVWLAGLRELWQRPELRCFVVAFGLVVGLTFGAAAQPHYPAFLMPTLFAAGVVAMVDRLDRGWLWRGLFAANAAVSLVVSLPLLPVGVLARTPIPDMNIVAADSVAARVRRRSRGDLQLRRGRCDRALPARRRGLQRPELALRPGPPGRRRHDGRVRRRPVRVRRGSLRLLRDPRPARQRDRRRQRGAGGAGGDLPRSAGAVVAHLAAAAAPRLTT